jgi:hypothetical protein
MSAEVIKFPNKPAKSTPTPEELHEQKLQLIEDCIDRNVNIFIRDMAENMPDIDHDLLEDIDSQTQKVIGLLRETMRATIFKFQNEHHDLQDVAEDIIVFDDDAREYVIEGD